MDKDKFTCYARIKREYIDLGFGVGETKEIKYGLQFEISKDDFKGKVRIYEGKKGIKVDHSAISDPNVIRLLTGEEMLPREVISGRVLGVDESGKGDYFGPLVVAACLVHKSDEDMLRQRGVKDSKSISDSKILELGAMLRGLYPHSQIVIGNTKYNELYDKIQNLNKLLAWGHSRAIENILLTHEADAILCDKFGKTGLIESKLFAKGREVKFYEKVRGEEDISVACASIIAREGYLIQMAKMGKEYGLSFPKGAGSNVDEFANDLVRARGLDFLRKVSKLHFKTTQKLNK